MMKSHLLRTLTLTVAGFVLLLLLTACAGVGTNSASGNATSITGTITNVDTTNHTVTLSVNGTSYTIKGLSDQTVQTLQGQIGKTYTVQVTQNSDGSYSITVGTDPTPAANETPGVSTTPEANETPEASETPGTGNATGSISLVASAQNVSSSSLSVTLPDNTTLTIAINGQTDQSDLNGHPLSNGQKVKIDADASASGFVASKIKLADNGDDVNQVEFQGTTTQALGSDRILHFTVGNHQFSYALGSDAEVKDFANTTIPGGASVKVTVQFNGTTGTITKVSSGD